ncbi:DUF4931 domain-containing protein [Xylocopilactobacillus apicola]|uniref:DUF4931 domain-containing protein n=1 Tax=Xylocopilactobacillus apicola TaxID=2932184 RepID=A0AAU9D6Y2_9LACO|nr:DUF4931 domain-containing protein [Xylocopilactobacillus apicola]BDR59308.1 DUF4931 domain-containing protein [Xylocopilactobacillus apicola]
MNLIFQPEVAQKKPHGSNNCPFCEPSDLTDILDQEGDCIWVVNKYRTLKDAWQTLIIETNQHDGDFSNYTQTQNRAIIKFAYSKWQEVIASEKFRSVLFYKNFGPHSGGSLTHPHMQIVGLDQIDVLDNVAIDNFTGIKVWEQGGVKVNLSTQPIGGFLEINFWLDSVKALDSFADSLQIVVRYLMNDYLEGRMDSYNLFFYQFPGQVLVKILARYVTSPYFVGYKIPQVNDEKTMEHIKNQLGQLLC